MALETEVKIEVTDLDGLKVELWNLNARRLSDRHLEENFVLDTKDGRLRSEGRLLRVRKTKGRESVTFKGPAKPAGIFKSREEEETSVEDADALLRILAHLGMEAWFKYEKFREEFSVPVSGGAEDEIRVALDATPIGNYVELEGSEEGIREVADMLGFKESQFLRDSYYSLFVRFCRRRGEPIGNMVFR